MQNEPYWYTEKDDDFFMTPDFEGPDFFTCQTEDKFVMTADMENQHHNSLDFDHNYEELQLAGNGCYMDKACLCNHSSIGDENVTYSKGYYHVDNKDQFEGEIEGKAEKNTVSCNCEVSFCKSRPGSGDSYGGDPTNFSYPDLKEIHLNDFHLKPAGDINSVNQSFDYYTKNVTGEGYKGPYDLTIKVSETDLPNGLDPYETRDDLEFDEECHDPKVASVGEDPNDDELLKYIQEDEYEVFDLRIIHRKNRFACRSSCVLITMLVNKLILNV